MKTKPINSQIEELKKKVKDRQEWLKDCGFFEGDWYQNNVVDNDSLNDYIEFIEWTKELTTLQEAQSQFLEMIDELDKLWFSYGNAIDDCYKGNNLKKAKILFGEFYVKYEELKSQFTGDKNENIKTRT